MTEHGVDLDKPFPVATLREALPHLRRPFAADAVRWKVQTVFKDNAGCLVVGYIDARLVVERLNKIVGGEWSAEYERFGDTKNLLLCRLTLYRTTRSDVGESTKGHSKDVYSDALKRAAVHFGVGVSVYALKQVRIFQGDQRTEVVNGKLGLTEAGHEWLRDRYAAWLEAKGEAKFGPALDHGDDFDFELPGADADVEGQVPVDDDRASELRAEVEQVWQQVHALSPRSITIGAKNRDLAACVTHEDLTALAHRYAEMYGRLTAASGQKAAA